MRFNIIIISYERKFIQKEAERKTIMTRMPLTKWDSADPWKILMPEKTTLLICQQPIISNQIIAR